MSRIDDMIKTLCPDGVEFVKLGEVCKIMNGKDYKHLDTGNIPVYGSGGVMTFVDDFVYDKPSVLLPRKGSLNKIYYVDTPFWTVDTIYWTKINSEEILPKYFYYYMSTKKLEKLNQAAGVPSLTQTMLNRIEIPIPPITIQAEIVRILDKFTQLEAELEAELDCRKRQYEFYRDQLLSFDKFTPPERNNVVWKKLSEVCKINRGKRLVKKELMTEGKIPVYQNSLTPLGYYKEANYPADTTFIISAGAAGNIGFSKMDFWAADDCICLVCDKNLNSKYLYYTMTNRQCYFLSRVRKASVPRLSRDTINKFEIAIPPIEEQNRIVAILDSFEALTTSLQHGLPAEIAARRQQYGYYRDKLLDFKRKNVQAECNKTCF